MIEIKQFDAKTIHQILDTEVMESVQATVLEIGARVKKFGDSVIIAATKEFDRISDSDFQLLVSEEDIKDAYAHVSDSFLEAIRVAKQNIESFHSNQLPCDWEEEHADGYAYGAQYSAISKVGLYVPGGRALYPSTVLMNAIPAQLAGVETIVMVTPPRSDGTVAPEVLVAAAECGVDTIIKSGGAQVIFGLAYGTESIPKVDKIVGPGNSYVDRAKQMVYGVVDIDKPAGPSEVLVYIDDPIYVEHAASECLAQLEHDPHAAAVVVASSQEIAEQVQEACQRQLRDLKRGDVIAQSAKNSSLFIASNRSEAIEMINTIASEHCVLLTNDSQSLRQQVRHAGAIFCGPYTPVALGDYIAGPNHVLPTAGAARFSSPLSVMDFMKFSSHLTFTKEALEGVSKHMEVLTGVESLDAHYWSIKRRIE